VTGPEFKDHFSARAANYAAFRPRYPDALFSWLATLVRQHERAWDAGTGNGQAAVALAAHFKDVIATDASGPQISQAEPRGRVRYAVGREAASGLAPSSCDLVTAAQALHWFDIPAFFAEARRVLRPDGAIAVWTYAQPAMDDSACDQVLQRYVQKMNPWWPPERAMVNEGYRGIEFPFAEVDPPKLEVELEVTREALLGYLRTWSAHGRFVAAERADPVDDVARDLASAWTGDGPRRLHWPLFVRAGHPR
jgi:SAM-dependent methyltransferase